MGFALAGVFLIAFIRRLCCWRNFKRFLFDLACFATLIALFYAEENWRGKHNWEKFKREWEAKGEHFDFASVVPPAVPDDQNFAMAPIWIESMEADYGSNVTWQWYGKKLTTQEQAKLVNRLHMSVAENDSSGPTNSRGGNWQKAALTDLTPWQNYYRKLATKTNLFPIAPQLQSPAQDVLLALGRYDSPIEELRQASRLPYSRFPLYSNADHPFDTLLPHLSALKTGAPVLGLRAGAELQNDQSDQALADVKLSLRLADAIRTEPFLISHLVRTAILQITLQPIYEGLAEHKWSEAQLAELDSELVKLDFLADFKLAMRGEMGCRDGAIDYLRRNRREVFSMMDQNNDTPVFISSLIPSGWFYQNQLRCDRMTVEFYLPLADERRGTISPTLTRRADAATEAARLHRNPYNILASMLFPAFGGAVKKFAYAQSSVDLARVAIALERYRQAHGEYPGSLDVLAPQFIAKIPHDIINCQPLHYRRTDDGQFVLYSVGWNETDDGGVVVFEGKKTERVDISQGDWVWRYPAK